jgi:VWFA-related protein
MTGARAAAVCVLALAAAARPPHLGAQQQAPRFTTSVEVTSVDVTVADGAGRPVQGLGASDFAVTVDGAARRVVSAEWVPLTTPPGGPALPPPPAGYSTNQHATGGRLILFVVDEPNIRYGGAAAIGTAVNAFIDRLQPSDRIAAVGIGPGSPATPFTADRTLVKEAIARMAGQRLTLDSTRYRIGLAEALDVRRGDLSVLPRIIQRECADEAPGTPGFDICAMAVQFEAERQAQVVVSEAFDTMATLRQLLRALAVIDAPKTVVLVSEGFVAADQEADIAEIGSLAAAARASVYALRLDAPLFDLSQRQAPIAALDDRQARSEGLEMLAGATRGTLMVVTAAADGIFERIERELSGYYLLAVETEPGDADGGRHPIRVRVGRSGVTVRARRELGRNPDALRPRGPRAALAAALASPLPITALPLRVATFSLRAPDGTIQILIHAEVGAGYPAARPVAVSYYITDPAGNVVDSQTAVGRLGPVMPGVPSALQFTGSANLPAGDYTLKFGASEGDSVGTVEHAIHAELIPAAPLELSELMAGGPAETRPRLAPTVGHAVSFGTLHGYMEAYGAGAAGIAVKYEVAAAADDPPLLEAEVTPRTAGNDRAIFTQTIPVRQLPPGEYLLRAVVTADGKPLKTLVRPFAVAPPAVLLTSAEGSGGTEAPSELFLPVSDGLLARAFAPAEALRAETLDAFRPRVAPAFAAAFEAGVDRFEAGDYPAAERSFKQAIDPDADSTAAFAYLAAVFAAAGHDGQAAGAWQTALIEGEDLPQIYLWLADALLRTHDLAQARAILEEALVKWPGDARFAKPMALVYATFGQGREAVRTLIRHLDANPGDVEALALAVEWIYLLHANGGAARTRGEDVAIAQRYAAAYQKARGPQAALVRQWMESLEGRRR